VRLRLAIGPQDTLTHRRTCANVVPVSTTDQKDLVTMLIRAEGITADHLAHLFLQVDAAAYDHNLSWNIDPVRTTRNGTTLRVKVGAGTDGPGSRLSASGRRGPWACWHAFRDLLMTVFEAYPDAVVSTAFATYRGAEDFAGKFPATAIRRTGGLYNSVTFVSLCAGLED
jgi:hypothetical protein